MPATLTPVPNDFGSGGKGIAPNSAPKGSPTLAEALQELQAALATGATGKIQTGTGTLVAGTFTVDTTIVLTANSKIFLSPAERPAGSANYVGLAVVSTTPGAAGVAEFDVEAVITDGSIDADAAFDVNWMIVD
jgi:hypothetical protein